MKADPGAMSETSWPAPAKINLFLRVTGRRPDGYHELQTLFQLLDWGDRVRLKPRADGRICRAAADYPVPEQEDLVVRAARLLQEHCENGSGVEIAVEKNVPLGSGLGGGSSDAATVLLVLNRMWECGLTLDELAMLGAGLGADVPVFVHGRSALATGIGDRLQPFSLGRRHYVLVFPGISIATADVFNDPDLKRDSALLSAEQIRAGQGGNDCTAVVTRRFPEMKTAMQSLRHWGNPMLTGTGSTVFIPMNDKKQANSTAREIKSLYNTRAVTGLDRSPVHEELYRDGD